MSLKKTLQYRVDPEIVIETLLKIIALETTEFEAYLTGLQIRFSEVYFKKKSEKSLFPRRFIKIIDTFLLESIRRYECAYICSEEYLKIRPNKDSDEEPDEDSDKEPDEDFYGDPDQILKRLLRIMVYQPTEWNDKFESVFKSVPTDLNFNLFNYEGLEKFYKKSFDYDDDYDLDLLKRNQFIDIQKSILDLSPKQRDQFDQKWGRMLKMRPIIDFPKSIDFGKPIDFSKPKEKAFESKQIIFTITIVFLLLLFLFFLLVFFFFSKSYRI
jgi:hypothetical protein